MAIRWKRSKMYGPRKPGIFRRWWWYWKAKLTTMNGLYVTSVMLLLLFLLNVVEGTTGFYGDSVFMIYITGLLNVAFWVYLVKRIDKETESPFFMNWMKKVDCDILILFYSGLFVAAFLFLASIYWSFSTPVYDWDGEYMGTYLNVTEFFLLMVPMAIVHNGLVMIIVRHLKDAELRKATFCRKTYHRIKEKFRELNQRYQGKYPFEKKVQLENFIMSAILVVIGILSFVSVSSWGFTKLFITFLILIGVAVLFIWFHYHKTFLGDVGLLVKEIHEVSSGNSLKVSSIPEDSIIYEAGEDLNHVYENLSASVEQQVKSEKMKIDLITNVSHDLKTPLTSIIGYIDLLKKTELNDEARDYVEVLSRKSEHLKHMIQDVFEISKATSGNMDMHMESVDLCVLMRQTLGDMEDRIEASGRVIRKTLSADPVYVFSDGTKIYRIYQNLIENALKYSLEGSRIFIDVFGDGQKVTTVIKNTSSYEMNFDEETITERFARADINRTTEGHGLGLAIVKSFVEACHGEFHIDIDGDLFKATVIMEQHHPEEEGEQTEELVGLADIIEAKLAENE